MFRELSLWKRLAAWAASMTCISAGIVVGVTAVAAGGDMMWRSPSPATMLAAVTCYAIAAVILARVLGASRGFLTADALVVAGAVAEVAVRTIKL